MARGKTYVPRPGRNKRRLGLPPRKVLLVVAALAAVVGLAAAVILLNRGSKEPDPPPPPVSLAPVHIPAPEPSPMDENGDVSNVALPEPPAPGEAVEKLDGFVTAEGVGYQTYKFAEETANKYIETVAGAAQALPEGCTLYDLIVPTALDVMLPENYIQGQEINSSDQRKAIEEYIFPSINIWNPDVKTVSCFDSLRAHYDDYIYFRTDYHWTQRGSYYAYQKFCQAKGVEPYPLEHFEAASYEGFLGSFYQQAASEAMEADTVEVFTSPADASFSFITTEGEWTEGWPAVQDGTGYASENLFLIFLAGDQPYEEIVNNDLTDGSACVVVKESFGNTFVPFLVDHYQYIYVVDYRYYTGNVAELAADVGAQDVILVNGIRMTASEELVESLADAF